jgi:hypothetical protein
MAAWWATRRGCAAARAGSSYHPPARGIIIAQRMHAALARVPCSIEFNTFKKKKKIDMQKTYNVRNRLNYTLQYIDI